MIYLFGSERVKMMNSGTNGKERMCFVYEKIENFQGKA